ncbi:hypothetical protein N7474_008560 [Penicillium riverlandense]|uniref:uncharacterized protein n=1 Tax=Penicillium riverlandense TaxID=1903569 RepID=UPI00254707FD|nr:uncharacterized protein N7474_008560 [Penicillium riverlandense]KAJ5812259.1 hypothetical protein N7474_008560 [Penicillium riverlandense]
MPPPRAAAAAFVSLHPAAHTTIASSSGISHAHANHRPQAHRIQLQTRLHPPILSSRTTPFSTSTHRSATAHEPNYYEILDIPVTATAAEIKKQFYALSLRHHPDRNRADPNASQRFARISAAYNVLGRASKRASYDREHGFHHAQQSHSHTHPMGSHSSHSAHHHKGGAGGGGSYAGSRPASGLSKRRGAFRGPPPSFYEQGGYGGTGRTAEGFAGGGFSGGSSSAWGGFGGKKKKQETDPEDPTAFIDRNPLGHFNARGHFRTQTAEDVRRRERRSRARAAAAENLANSSGAGPGDFALRFMVVSGSLMIAGAMTGLLKWPGAAGSGSSGSATTSTGTGTGGKKSGSAGGRGEAVSGP